VILETQTEHLFACLKAGTVSTNVQLRKLHNFCISMNWLPWPLIPKRLWLPASVWPAGGGYVLPSKNDSTQQSSSKTKL
jgi:hypothetical protein